MVYLECPSLAVDRVQAIHQSIDSWMRSTALSRLVESFGEEVPEELDTASLVSWLLSFSERWDFRRMQQNAAAKDIGEGARWLLDNSQLTPRQKTLIEESATILGLTNIGEPTEQSYDYVLVLGGARLSCLLRPRLAAELVRDRQLQPKAVVMLGSARPVADSERDATNTYAPSAMTEFDLMNAGAEASFDLDADHTEEHYDAPDSSNSSWRVRTSRVSGCPYPLISMSAPSSEPDKRRANSADTYEFFFSKYGVERGASLLLVTSAIYVPYQQLEALRTLALPHDVMIETVGFPAEWGGQLQGMAGPTNYLQEIRSTIQSANRFIQAFPREGSR